MARQDIEELLQVARLAPSGGNQMVRWVVLRAKSPCAACLTLWPNGLTQDARANPKYAARYAIDNILYPLPGGEDVILRGRAQCRAGLYQQQGFLGAGG